MKGRGKREIPEETRRPTASSGTIPTCDKSVIRPGIEPGSPCLEMRDHWHNLSICSAKTFYFVLHVDTSNPSETKQKTETHHLLASSRGKGTKIICSSNTQVGERNHPSSFNNNKLPPLEFTTIHTPREIRKNMNKERTLKGAAYLEVETRCCVFEIRVHAAQRKHCTPIQRLERRSEGASGTRVNVVLIGPALPFLKRAENIQVRAGGALKRHLFMLGGYFCVPVDVQYTKNPSNTLEAEVKLHAMCMCETVAGQDIQQHDWEMAGQTVSYGG
ncbi:hypothetical protein PR048_030008 [Dryococelus australis]|uniref:Uncharacterized protein n=1 Tax=Dryococelus australis TaxID=614101 RepID=A0ABQ9G7Q8_9NEOP|nr:hypothetical protein PR048_030008 [Dryococelus australis]